MADTAQIKADLERVEDPFLRRTLAELGMIEDVETRRRGALVTLRLPSEEYPHREALAESLRQAVGGPLEVRFTVMSDEEQAALAQRLKTGAVGGPGSATRVIAVGSGKGGVGKSTLTANLAVALASHGRSVGVLDADVWGFSIPAMLGVKGGPAVVDGMLVPPERHGVRVVSMDFFVQPDQAVIWRGPMLHKAVEQFLGDVFWDDPDYLLVDMPPGTGDVAISLSQFLPRAEAVIVTTPQPTAQRVAKRAGLMARKVNQEILGVVENMSWLEGESGSRLTIFGEGGGELLAKELEVPLLGQIPLDPELRAGADAGVPYAELDVPAVADAFRRLAQEIEERRPKVRTHPELVIR